MKTTVNNKIKYAAVIPCYNEEDRFQYEKFLAFAKANKDVLLCFVNDGSKDKTLAVLNGIQYECSDNISVLSLDKNSGKSEAVRQGMLYVYENFTADLIGFLDADLATTLEEWLKMAEHKLEMNQYGAIVGSRIMRLGANIVRDDNRSLASFVVKQGIKFILKTSFQDTQCGAKIFSRNIVPFLFSKKFLTPWLFDVEIFLRLQQKFGKTTLQYGVLEYPLMEWTEIGGSKLKLKDTIKIPLQLMRLYYLYDVKPRLKNNTMLSEHSKNEAMKKVQPFFSNLAFHLLK